MFDSESDSWSFPTCEICGKRLDTLRYGSMAKWCVLHEGGLDGEQFRPAYLDSGYCKDPSR